MKNAISVITAIRNNHEPSRLIFWLIASVKTMATANPISAKIPTAIPL
jgi:hypothetical protein